MFSSARPQPKSKVAPRLALSNASASPGPPPSSSPSQPRAAVRPRSPSTANAPSEPLKKARVDELLPNGVTPAVMDVVSLAVESLGDCDEAWEAVGAALATPNVAPFTWKLRLYSAGKKAEIDGQFNLFALSLSAVAAHRRASLPPPVVQEVAPERALAGPRKVEQEQEADPSEESESEGEDSGFNLSEADSDDLDGDDSGEGNYGWPRPSSWTEAEIEKLFHLYDRNRSVQGKPVWDKILAQMGGRSLGACKNQLRKRETRPSHAGALWTKEEDEKLKAAYKTLQPKGKKGWAQLARLFKGRSRAACQLHFYSFKATGTLDVPSTATGRKKTRAPTKWKKDELATLFRLYDQLVDPAFNVDWDQILPQLPNRTLYGCWSQLSERNKRANSKIMIRYPFVTQSGLRRSETWTEFLERTSQAPASQAGPSSAAPTNRAPSEAESDSSNDDLSDDEDDDDAAAASHLLGIVRYYDAEGIHDVTWEKISDDMTSQGTPRSPNECLEMWNKISEQLDE